MSSDTGPTRLPGRAGFTIAALLAILAIAIGTVVTIVIVRAVTGYSISTIEPNQPTFVTLSDRGEAVWMSPETASGTCRSVDDQQQPSIGPGSADTITITDGGRTWTRVGIIEGPPSSRHALVCEDEGGAEQFGHAPNPQVGKYVLLGVGGGLTSMLVGTLAIVLAIVTGVRRSRARKAARVS